MIVLSRGFSCWSFCFYFSSNLFVLDMSGNSDHGYVALDSEPTSSVMDMAAVFGHLPPPPHLSTLPSRLRSQSAQQKVISLMKNVYCISIMTF